MKQKKKLLRPLFTSAVLAAAAVLTAALFAGCGASNKSNSYAMDSYALTVPTEETEAGMVDTADLGAGEVNLEAGENANLSGRKIIYNADVSIETETFDEASQTIRQLLNDAGGYLSATSAEGNAEAGSRFAHYTARVPSDRYQTFLDELSGAGNVYSISQYTEDITAQYVDVEARLKSLSDQRTRLEELAAEAEDIETLLAIETKLSDVQYQIESYTAQMRTYDDQVDYSTVNVYLYEVAKVSEGTGFGTRLRAAFSGSWKGFVNGVQEFVIGVVYLLPGLIVMAVICAIAIPLILRARKKHLAARPEAMRVQGLYQAPGWKDGQPQPKEEQKKDENET